VPGLHAYSTTAGIMIRIYPGIRAFYCIDRSTHRCFLDADVLLQGYIGSQVFLRYSFFNAGLHVVHGVPGIQTS
jgi:hypothetical protein